MCHLFPCCQSKNADSKEESRYDRDNSSLSEAFILFDIFFNSAAVFNADVMELSRSSPMSLCIMIKWFRINVASFENLFSGRRIKYNCIESEYLVNFNLPDTPLHCNNFQRESDFWVFACFWADYVI